MLAIWAAAIIARADVARLAFPRLRMRAQGAILGALRTKVKVKGPVCGHRQDGMLLDGRFPARSAGLQTVEWFAVPFCRCLDVTGSDLCRSQGVLVVRRVLVVAASS